MIYFIGCKRLNICKIGYSQRPLRRLQTLQVSFPFELELLNKIEGTIQDEKKFHKVYEEHKLKGEWFILDKIEELKEVQALFETVHIGEHKIHVDCNSFYSLADTRKLLNAYDEEPFAMCNTSAILNSKGMLYFIQDFHEKKGYSPINRLFGGWTHLYLFVEIVRTGSPKLKHDVYSLMLDGKLPITDDKRFISPNHN